MQTAPELSQQSAVSGVFTDLKVTVVIQSEKKRELNIKPLNKQAEQKGGGDTYRTQIILCEIEKFATHHEGSKLQPRLQQKKNAQLRSEPAAAVSVSLQWKHTMIWI